MKKKIHLNYSYIKECLLFGLYGITVSGFYTVAKQSGSNLFAVLFRMDTIYCFFTIFGIFVPGFASYSLFKEKSLNIKKTLIQSAICSIITMGIIVLWESFETLFGTLGYILAIVLTAIYILLYIWLTIKEQRQRKVVRA